MKCQNCGNNMAVFHYTANINGRKAETHLCAECAAGAGFTGEDFFEADMFGSILSDFFSGFFAPVRSGFFPESGRLAMPVMAVPRIEVAVKNDEAQKEKVTVEKDESMSRRREINILREQMKAAVDAEDFEKAAELRDKIRELDKQG